MSAIGCMCVDCLEERAIRNTYRSAPIKKKPSVFKNNAGDYVVTRIDKAAGTIELSHPEVVALRLAAQRCDAAARGLKWRGSQGAAGQILMMNANFNKALKALEEAAAELADDERKAAANQAVKKVVSGYNVGASKHPGPYPTTLPSDSFNGASNAYVPAPAKDVVAKKVEKTGFSCKRCGNLNEHATANQSDGTYLCYECR